MLKARVRIFFHIFLCSLQDKNYDTSMITMAIFFFFFFFEVVTIIVFFNVKRFPEPKKRINIYVEGPNTIT